MRLVIVRTREGNEYDVLILATEPAAVSLAIANAVYPERVEAVDARDPNPWPDFFVVRGSRGSRGR